MNEWTLYLITDTGRKVPHWTDTYAKCRTFRKHMGKLPTGVTIVLERKL